MSRPGADRGLEGWRHRAPGDLHRVEVAEHPPTGEAQRHGSCGRRRARGAEHQPARRSNRSQTERSHHWTRVCSGPPVAFHISATRSIRVSSFRSLLDVERALHRGRLLGGHPETVMQIEELLDVRRQVVVPQAVEVADHPVGAPLLDVDAAGLEMRIVAGGVLLEDPRRDSASIRARSGS